MRSWAGCRRDCRRRRTPGRPARSGKPRGFTYALDGLREPTRRLCGKRFHASAFPQVVCLSELSDLRDLDSPGHGPPAAWPRNRLRCPERFTLRPSVPNAVAAVHLPVFVDELGPRTPPSTLLRFTPFYSVLLLSPQVKSIAHTSARPISTRFAPITPL
jgi:hypothetical protein